MMTVGGAVRQELIVKKNSAEQRYKAAMLIAMAASRTAFEGTKLPAVTDNLDNIPEAMRGFYEKDGDNFVLSVDDSSFKKKLSEFRDSNITLMKDKEKLEAQLADLKDVDPAKYKEMKKKLEEMEDKDLLDEGKIEELVAVRTERMRKDFDSQITALTERAEAAERSTVDYKGKLEGVLIDSQITAAASAVGNVRKGAMPDVLARARGVWTLDDSGNPVALNADGSKRYGKDGDKPLSMSEWATDLLQEAAFLFEGSSGGGSSNSDRGGRAAPGQVLKSDRKGFSTNIEEIAKGKVQVAS